MPVSITCPNPACDRVSRLSDAALDKRVLKVDDFGKAMAYDECKLSGLTMQGEMGGTPA